jgi:hypothetical protein
MTRTSLALLGVCLAWAIHLVASYALAWAACAGDGGWLLALRHLATVAAALLGIGVLFQAARAATAQAAPAGGAQSGPAGGSPAAPVSGAPERAAEHRYVARLSVLLSLMLLFAIVMTGAANLFLAPCV